jgi:predicted amidohydrolase
MSRTLVVAAGQMGPASDDKSANIETVLRLMDVGDSVVVTPLGGEVLVRAKTDGNEVLLAEIDLEDVAEARTRMPFPRDRRPEHYRELSEPTLLRPASL